MGTNDVIKQEDFSNTAITDVLDKQFPLRSGSHRDVKAYLEYFNNLMAIKFDGSTTSLVTPSQFETADGSLDGLTAISLSTGEIHVQIYLQSCQSGGPIQHPCIDRVHLNMVLSA